MNVCTMQIDLPLTATRSRVSDEILIVAQDDAAYISMTDAEAAELCRQIAVALEQKREKVA